MAEWGKNDEIVPEDSGSWGQPAWAPPKPEEMDALAREATRPLPGPYRRQEPRAGDAVRLFGNGMAFNALPSAAAALTATVPALDPEMAGRGETWDERYRHARGLYRSLREGSRENLPNAAPTIETAGALTSGLIGGPVLAPVSHAARTAPIGARVLAGALDAIGVNALATGVERAGAPGASTEAGFWEGAKEGATSPWNALGPLFTMLGEGFGVAADRAGRKSALKAVDALDPRKAAATAIRDDFAGGRFGEEGAVNLGDVIRGLRLPDGTPVLQRGDTAGTIANKLKVLRQRAMEEKGAVVDYYSRNGVKVDASALLADLYDAFNSHLNTQAARVPQANAAPRRTLQRTLDNFSEQYGVDPNWASSGSPVVRPAEQLSLALPEQGPAIPGAKIVAPDTVVPAGEPVQTGLGLPGVEPQKVVVGFDAQPDTVIPGGPPAQAGLGIPFPDDLKPTGGYTRLREGERLVNAETPPVAPHEMALFEEAGITPPPGEAPRMEPYSEGPIIAHGVGQQGNLFTGYDIPPAPVPAIEVPGEHTPTYGYQGRSFTGYEIPPAPAPETVVPGEEIGQELLRQLRWGGSGFEAPAPQTPKSHLTLRQAEDLKTELQNVIHQVKNPLGRDRAAIDSNPTLKVMDRWRGTVRDTDRAVVEALSPEAGAEFRQANVNANKTAGAHEIAQAGAAAEAQAVPVSKLDRAVEAGLRHAGWALPAAAAGYGAHGIQGAVVGGAAGLLAPALVPLPSTQSVAWGGVERGLRGIPKIRLDPNIVNALIAGESTPSEYELMVRKLREGAKAAAAGRYGMETTP